MGKIYKLVDPITKTPRYVGYTSKPLEERLRGHWLERTQLSTHKHFWISKLWDVYKTKPIIELIENVNADNWEIREIELIAEYRRKYPGLTNILDGGQGAKRDKLTLEHRRKISIGLKGKTKGKPKLASKGRLAWNAGLTKETNKSVANISKNNLGVSRNKGKPNPHKGNKNNRANTYQFISPNGETFQHTGLRDFCRIHNLHASNMAQVAKGTLKQYKGWCCTKVDNISS